MNLGAFFSTFQAKDWVTSAAAFIAIVISGWTLSQTWRYHPKPLLIANNKIAMHNTTDPGELDRISGPGLSFAIANSGNGIAYDLHITVDSPAIGSRTVYPVGMLEPGAAKKTYVSLANGEQRPSTNDGNTITRAWHEVTHVDLRRVKVVMRWRQSPSMWLVRGKRVRFK